MDGLLCSPAPRLPQFYGDLNLSSRIKICSVMTWFSYKEEINLTAGTRRGINLQSSRAPLFPFQFLCNRSKKRVNDSVCISARVTLLRRKRAGKWGVDIRQSWKKDFPFFRDRATDKKAERWSRADPLPSMVCPGLRRGRWPRGRSAGGALGAPGYGFWSPRHNLVGLSRCEVGSWMDNYSTFQFQVWPLAQADPRWRQSPLCSRPKDGLWSQPSEATLASGYMTSSIRLLYVSYGWRAFGSRPHFCLCSMWKHIIKYNRLSVILTVKTDWPFCKIVLL